MYLGIDLGTSELKVLLLSQRHDVLAVARAPLTVQRPQPLWAEQHPADWWRALEIALDELSAKHRLVGVRAVGLSGQMHGAVLLDEAGDVLRPAMLWNDGRSGAQCEALTKAVPALTQIAGNLAMPGFTAPKLLWVQEHEPEVFQRVARVLLPKDWLRFKLTGEAVSEMSDASGTLWLDVGARRWSPELLAACGLHEAQMPRLVEGSAVSATLKPGIAARWGLQPVPVAGGAGDNAASAVGMGVVAPGQGFVSLGTSGVVFVSGDRFAPNPAPAMHAFCHALPGRWHQMSVMLSAASAVSWATRAFGFESEAALHSAATACTAEQRERAPLFLPYLSGERTPHNDPLLQGALGGLTHEHHRAALAYAVVEGVSFGLLDGWRTLDTAVDELSVVGGGARSAFWVQLLASTLGVPLRTHAGSEAGAALGAARLGWLADGGSEEEVCPLPPTAVRYLPQPAWREPLAARHARFRALVPRLRGS